MLGFQLATWDMNPELPFECAFLQSELKKNPDDFWRDYGAQPSKATEKYYRDRIRIDRAFKRGLKYGLTNPVTQEGVLIDTFKGKPDVPYYIHLDPSANNCAFGIAMGHTEGKKIIIDLARKFVAPLNQEIDYARVGEFLDTLLDRFEIEGLTYDVYLTVEMMQRLKSKYAITPAFLRVGKKEHDNLKIVAIYGGRIYLYTNPVLRTELRELDLLNGKKVDHPVHFADGSPGTNDIGDAVAGVVLPDELLPRLELALVHAREELVVQLRPELREDARLDESVPGIRTGRLDPHPQDSSTPFRNRGLIE